MENKLCRDYYLRTSDFDRFGHLLPCALLDLFQDAAGVHATRLGCGYKDLAQRNLLWVLVRSKYRVLENCSLFDRVTVETWPLEPNRVTQGREYLLRGADGRVLVLGSSEWVLMHSVRRCFMPAKDIYSLDSFLSDRNFPEKDTKLHDFESDSLPYIITPSYSQIDINGHVNNTKYTNFILDAAPLAENEQIESLRIDYKHEVRAGNRLSVFVKRDEDTLLSKGVCDDGKNAFLCEMKIKSPGN